MINLSNYGGGDFVPTFHSGRQEIEQSSSGTILTLTPPTGERVRLTMFSPSSTFSVSDLQLNIDGVQVCLGDCTGESSQVSDWCVSSAGGANSSISNEDWAGYIPEVLGGVDEVITVVATGGNISSEIYYGYQTGVLK